MGSIRFEYDPVNDIHFAYPTWTIETEQDCREWFAQYERYFARMGKRVDVVFILDSFHIGRGIGSVWGQYRATMVNRFTRYSVRLNPDAKVSTFSATSGALHRAASQEAPTLKAAVQVILALRQAADPVQR